jgi:hypothetical protein
MRFAKAILPDFLKLGTAKLAKDWPADVPKEDKPWQVNLTLAPPLGVSLWTTSRRTGKVRCPILSSGASYIQSALVRSTGASHHW